MTCPMTQPPAPGAEPAYHPPCTLSQRRLPRCLRVRPQAGQHCLVNSGIECPTKWIHLFNPFATQKLHELRPSEANSLQHLALLMVFGSAQCPFEVVQHGKEISKKCNAPCQKPRSSRVGPAVGSCRTRPAVSVARPGIRPGRVRLRLPPSPTLLCAPRWLPTTETRGETWGWADAASACAADRLEAPPSALRVESAGGLVETPSFFVEGL